MIGRRWKIDSLMNLRLGSMFPPYRPYFFRPPSRLLTRDRSTKARLFFQRLLNCRRAGENRAKWFQVNCISDWHTFEWTITLPNWQQLSVTVRKGRPEEGVKKKVGEERGREGARTTEVRKGTRKFHCVESHWNALKVFSLYFLVAKLLT